MYKQRLLTPQVAGPYEGMLRVLSYQTGFASRNSDKLLCFLTLLQDLPHILDQRKVEWQNGTGEDATVVRVEQEWTLYVPADSERAVKRCEAFLRAVWYDEQKPLNVDTVNEVIAAYPLDMELEGIDPTALPNYLVQFRRFEPLEFDPADLPIPFITDTSWCQNLNPSFTTGDGEESEGELILYVDFPNVEDREHESYKRFCVNYCLGDYDNRGLFDCETLEELRAFLEEYKENPAKFKTWEA